MDLTSARHICTRVQNPDAINDPRLNANPALKAQLQKDLAARTAQAQQQQTAKQLVRMQGPNGTQDIPNDPGLIANFMQTHPGYKNLGVVSNPTPTPSSTVVAGAQAQNNPQFGSK